MIVRLVAVVAAASVLAGCSSEEGLRAQELLRQSEVAQAKLSSSAFDGSLGISADGMKMRMSFNGATSKDGEWFSMRASGGPNAGDTEMQVVVRGGKAWLNADGRWRPGQDRDDDRR